MKPTKQNPFWDVTAHICSPKNHLLEGAQRDCQDYHLSLKGMFNLPSSIISAMGYNSPAFFGVFFDCQFSFILIKGNLLCAKKMSVKLLGSFLRWPKSCFSPILSFSTNPEPLFLSRLPCWIPRKDINSFQSLFQLGDRCSSGTDRKATGNKSSQRRKPHTHTQLEDSAGRLKKVQMKVPTLCHSSTLHVKGVGLLSHSCNHSLGQFKVIF